MIQPVLRSGDALAVETGTAAKAGTAVAGFIKGALTKTAGDQPNVSGWYGAFLQQVALPN